MEEVDGAKEGTQQNLSERMIELKGLGSAQIYRGTTWDHGTLLSQRLLGDHSASHDVARKEKKVSGRYHR